MDCWKFTPYDRVKWNNAEERILFVASEPNGDQPNGEKDMGHWFRTAAQNNFYKNEPFYRRSEIMLNGLNGKNGFDCFRFMDLKATQGGSEANPVAVSDYVEDNMNDVLKYFNSTDDDFGLSPHIIVLLGNTAQSIFSGHIRHKVNNQNLKWIGMPDPSAQVGYEGLKYASKNIRQHLKPINQQTKKWVYHKDWVDHKENKDYGWRSIS
jgi:hypothetical protein